MNRVKTVNIEAGMPTVEEARQVLISELKQAKQSGLSAVKVIHGCGSTGKGGALHGALRTSLLRRKKERLVARVIFDERWSVFEEDARYAIERCPACAATTTSIAATKVSPLHSWCRDSNYDELGFLGFSKPMPDTQSTPPRSLLRRVALPLVGLLLLFYVADLAWYELRIISPKLGLANGSVHRTRVLAIAEKNNKVEYEIDSNRPEEDVPCSHSLFPHAGNRPCWYVTRHANDPIPM